MTPNGFKNLLHSYIFSPLMYQMYIITPSNEFFKKVRKIANNFLWPGKAKVGYKKLMHSPENFGIGLWDPKLRADALKSSLLLRIIKTPSSLNNAINEIFYNHNNNQFLQPSLAKISTTSIWLKSAIKNIPLSNTNTTEGGVVARVKRPHTIFDVINRKKAFSLKEKSENTYIHHIETKLKKSNLFPINFSKNNNGEIQLLPNSLLSTINKLFPEKALSTKAIYNQLVFNIKPPPQLSPSTHAKLEKYQLTPDVFRKLWKLKLRPGAKNFFFLWLRNSNPIAHGEPCPLCTKNLHQSHLWGKCPVTEKSVSELDPRNLPQFVINLFSVWLTFCHFQHNSTPTIHFEDFLKNNLEREKSRHESIRNGKKKQRQQQ